MDPLALLAMLWIVGGVVAARWLGGRIQKSVAVEERRAGRTRCMTCQEWFVPTKLLWERTSKCLDGLEYCDTCKRQGRCGCA